MCGIAGALYWDGRTADERVLRKMADAIAHRGPDGSGVRSFAGVGLAHRRLAIIDLSDAAAQPLGSSAEDCWVVFNGEIYNYLELRDRLASRGLTFRSSGDTEVLLQAFVSEGADSIARLDGMFAFAIWDARSKRLVLARDRTGKKPLYVYEDDEKVVFASEIKAILEHPGVDTSIDASAVPRFLSHGYVPTPHTFYRRIRKLPPASYEIFDLGRRTSFGPKAFWDFPTAVDSSVSFEVAERNIRELFVAAVKRRLISDVPLGAFLSGGVDSTLAVGVMAQLSSRPVRTFSIGFDGYPDYDETPYARLVARRFGTEHTEFHVRPDAFDLVEKIAWHFDEPFGDYSALPTYIVSLLTRKSVTVAITGDGGDEVFAGYPRFLAAAAMEQLPRPVASLLRRASEIVPGGSRHSGLRNRAKRLLRQAERPIAERVRGWLTYFNAEELQQLLLGGAVDEWDLGSSYVAALRQAGNGDIINRLLYLNAKTYLLEDLNVKMDRASMAASLEARAPFLDTALMEYAFRLPGRWKMRGRTTKWILKRAFADLLPPEVVGRPKKGFGIPLGAWFRGKLRTTLGERLLDPRAHIYDFVAREPVENVFREHDARYRDFSSQLWLLWMLELFLGQRAQRQAA